MAVQKEGNLYIACVDDITQITRSHEHDNDEIKETKQKADVMSLPVPPDGGYGWVVCAGAFLVMLILDGMLFSFGVLFIDLLDYFQASKSKTAWVGSTLMGTHLLFGPLTSALVNVFGIRVVAMTGACIATLSFAVSVVSPSIDILIVTYGVFGGIGISMVYLPTLLAVGFYFDKRRALANGIANSGSGFGTFVYAPLCSYLQAEFGWRGALLILSGLVFECLILVALFRPVEQTRVIRINNYPKTMLTDEEENLIFKAGDQGNDIHNGSIYKPVQTNKTEKSVSDSEQETISLLTMDQNRNLYENELTKDETLSYKIARSKSHSTDLNQITDKSKLHLERSSVTRNPIAAIQSKDFQKFLQKPSGLVKSNQNVLKFQENLTFAFSRSVNPGKPKLPQHIFTNSAWTINAQDEASQESHKYLSLGNINEPERIIHHHLRNRKNTPHVLNKPLHRKDIFYSGSVCKLDEVKGRIEELFHMPTDENFSNRGDCDVTHCGAINESNASYTKELVRGLRIMAGISVLKSPLFLLSMFMSVLWTAHSSVLTILPNHATLNGISANQASFLVSIIGITNILGRLISGWLAVRYDCVIINGVALFMGGVVNLAFPFSHNYYLLATEAAVFGYGMGTWTSLRPIVLVDLLGIDKLTNAFGLLAMFQGAAFCIGSPIAGLLFDFTESYKAPFLVAGCAFLASSMLCIPLCLLGARQRKSRSVTNDLIVDS